MGCFVKICGMTRAEDVAEVIALRPDAVGFICWPGSGRYVAPEQAAALARDVPAGILKVGVFVDAPPDEVRRVSEAAGFDVAQLHGAEEPAGYAGMGLTLWKAVHLDRPGAAVPPEGSVDALLVDGYTAEAPGGTGVTADWDRARAFVARRKEPVLLAGGLTPDNVGEAVHAVHPWGVDVSSGVESAPGIKDLEKVRTFIERCRNL